MDLIIELIVWIVKSLSGENSNSTVNKGGSNMPSSKRGQYNYGDGRPGAPGKARTLEEILEEVKRQQAQGKANAPRSGAQRAASPERAKQQPLSRPLSEVQAPTAAARPAGAPGAIQSSLETRLLRPTLDQKEPAKPRSERIQEREDQRGRGKGQEKMAADANPAGAVAEIQSIVGMEAGSSDKKLNAFSEMFKALKASPGKSKVEFARRAVVYAEVFGPPRSKRPLRRR